MRIVKQCELMSISRSSCYYEGQGESGFNLEPMRLIDEILLEAPYCGSRQIAKIIRRLGYCVAAANG